MVYQDGEVNLDEGKKELIEAAGFNLLQDAAKNECQEAIDFLKMINAYFFIP